MLGRAAVCRLSASSAASLSSSVVLLQRVFLRSFSVTVGAEIPINYKKEGKHPKVLPREQYPPWLWTVTNVTTLTECERKGYDNMKTMSEKRRYVQLLNTKDIKEKNLNRTL